MAKVNSELHWGSESSRNKKEILSFPGAKRPGSERARKGISQAGRERVRERKFRGTSWPGSERALEQKLQGANWPVSYWPIRSGERLGPEAKRLGTVWHLWTVSVNVLWVCWWHLTDLTRSFPVSIKSARSLHLTKEYKPVFFNLMSCGSFLNFFTILVACLLFRHFVSFWGHHTCMQCSGYGLT